MDNQIDYLIDKYPVRAGITTHFIAGDDHEGWYAQREGIEIGRYMETRAREAGRNDLHYLGYAESDVSLRCGAGASVMRVVHPGVHRSYALSYTAQKLVESYQGGEKPQILIVGHYHKAEYCFPREVHCLRPPARKIRAFSCARKSWRRTLDSGRSALPRTIAGDRGTSARTSFISSTAAITKSGTSSRVRIRFDVGRRRDIGAFFGDLNTRSNRIVRYKGKIHGRRRKDATGKV